MLSAGAGRMITDLITGNLAQTDNPLRLSRFEEGIVTQGKSFLRH